jgi:hypothetical protein
MIRRESRPADATGAALAGEIARLGAERVPVVGGALRRLVRAAWAGSARSSAGNERLPGLRDEQLVRVEGTARQALLVGAVGRRFAQAL